MACPPTARLTEELPLPPGHGIRSNGVNATARRSFRSKVIGLDLSRRHGEWLQDQEGTLAAATQLFDLGKTVGEKMIVTEGLLLPEVNVPIKRAITGGTGKYAGRQGEGSETVLGFPNRAGGVNSQVVLKVMR